MPQGSAILGHLRAGAELCVFVRPGLYRDAEAAGQSFGFNVVLSIEEGLSTNDRLLLQEAGREWEVIEDDGDVPSDLDWVLRVLLSISRLQHTPNRIEIRGQLPRKPMLYTARTVQHRCKSLVCRF